MISRQNQKIATPIRIDFKTFYYSITVKGGESRKKLFQFDNKLTALKSLI